jgi:hypothetical protein
VPPVVPRFREDDSLWDANTNLLGGLLGRAVITHPQRQRRHNRAPLGMRIARPVRDLIQRAIAANADVDFWIHHTDFFAGGFDSLESGGHILIIAACCAPAFDRSYFDCRSLAAHLLVS